MREAGLSLAEQHLHRGSFSADLAEQAVMAMAAARTPPTAIFASSDYLAIGAMRGLRRAGLVVPRDMSLVSFDDTPLSAMLTPALTAIQQPIEALGRHGFQALYALMQRKRAPKLTRLPVTLIERDSVASPRARGRS
jgi:LacI family transcriptional regulator